MLRTTGARAAVVPQAPQLRRVWPFYLESPATSQDPLPHHVPCELQESTPSCWLDMADEVSVALSPISRAPVYGVFSADGVSFSWTSGTAIPLFGSVNCGW